MKIIRKGDIQKMISSNMGLKPRLLLVLSHRKVGSVEDSRTIGKALLDSNMDQKTIQRYLKLLFYYESKLEVGLEVK